jgi:signal peptide peptidase SppA
MHEEVQAIYARHCRGEKIDLRAMEASTGKTLANEPAPYQVEHGVAVLPVEGVIAKRMTLLSKISGGASSSFVGQQFQAALSDPQVKAIILAIDSPGGAVDGTQELGNLIAAARGQKPILAFTDGQMCSAAYWLGSAADQIFISGDTTIVGSIGVLMPHVDVSAADAMAGEKHTVITAGKYKAAAHAHAPLSEDGLGVLQSLVDSIYTAFVNDVARNRGVDPGTVIQDMAEGRVFVGKQALEAGLVDGVSTLEALIEQLSQDGFTPSQALGAGAALTPSTPPMETTMNKEELLAQHPELAKALMAEGHATGAAAELTRIQAVLASGLPGHEALVQQLAFDGKTSGPEAAMQVLTAERAKRGQVLAEIEATAPKPAPHAPAPAAALPDADSGAPLEEQCKATWDKTPEVRQEFGTLEVYTAFRQAEQAGQARILNQKKK